MDLCYDKLIYDPVPHNVIGVLARHNRDHSVLCGSASKVYAMTGWRCGWAVGPAALVGACNAIQSHSTSNVCSITQKAVEAGLRGPQECVTEMLDEYRRRRDQLFEWLSADPRIGLRKPAGAFYMFPDVSEFLSPDGFRTSADLATALLNDAHVALTPGEAFDAQGSCISPPPPCRSSSVGRSGSWSSWRPARALVPLQPEFLDALRSIVGRPRALDDAARESYGADAWKGPSRGRRRCLTARKRSPRSCVSAAPTACRWCRAAAARAIPEGRCRCTAGSSCRSSA
jgi:hypothetical protein